MTSALNVRVSAHRGSAEVERVPGGMRLRGEVAWVFEGPVAELRDIAEALPSGLVEWFGSVVVVRFGNAVGRFRLPHLGTVEVFSGKWNETSFDRMLADLTARMASLPFAAEDTAKLPYDRRLATHPEVLYQAFVYLRHVLTSSAADAMRLVPALEAIVREPHLRYVPERRRVPLTAATAIEPAYLVGLASGREPFERATGSVAKLSLARALRGHLPTTVVETRTARTYDTAENRFVKSFLELAESIIERMRDHAGAKPSGRRYRRVLEDCDSMSRALRPYRRATLWDEVGRMTQIPASSPVLQRRRGYREVYRHFVRLRSTSRLPLGPTALDDLLELKDIAELYELWCYFSIVDAISTTLGLQPLRAHRFTHLATHVFVPHDFQVEWQGGIRCLYNARFSRSRTENRRSYSVPLRPDIVLEIAEGPARGLHLFDAKFRVDWRDPLGAGGEEDALDERRGTAKRADLYKMHTYRDALPAVRSVRVLYPGTQAVFYSADARDAGPGAALDGVGVVPLEPLASEEALLDVIRQLFASSRSEA